MKLRLFACVLLVSLTVLGAQTTSHSFSVKDDIAMSRFNDPSEEQEDFDANHVKYSPDGRHVAIVTTRGLLASDEFETVLSVFNMNEVRVAMMRGVL